MQACFHHASNTLSLFCQMHTKLVLESHKTTGVFVFGDLARYYRDLFPRPEGLLYQVSGD